MATNPQPGNEYQRRKKNNVVVPLVLGSLFLLLVAGVFIFSIISRKENTKSETKQKVDKITTIVPITKIDLPPSNGEIMWSDVSQAELTKSLTTTPDLKGEKVLLVYIIKGHPMGDMVWIQTDANGSVKNIFCEKKYTKL